MNKTDLAKELKSRITSNVKSLRKTINDPLGNSTVALNAMRELEILDQLVNERTFLTLEDFMKYLLENEGKTVDVETSNGFKTQLIIDKDQVYVKSNIKLNEESEYNLKDPWALYLSPPHGELLWAGKKTAIVKSVALRQHMEEPIYLCSGKYCYGVINVSKPRSISLEEFKKLASRHQITELERKKWWPNATSLYYYPITFIRRGNPPIEWKVQQGAQMFVKGVEFTEASNSARFIFMFQEHSKVDEVSPEIIKKEIERYGDYYKIDPKPGKSYRYVIQKHSEGTSVHADLRIELEDHLIGFTLCSSTLVGKILDVPTKLKLIQMKEWLNVKGKVELGLGAVQGKAVEFRTSSSGTVKFGVQKSNFHEIFLTPDSKWGDTNTKGIWTIICNEKGAWLTSKPENQKPFAESQDYEESVDKAREEKSYLVWQHPEKGRLKPTVDFRENRKKSWVYK